MLHPTFFFLILLGSCFGIEKRQSEYEDFDEAKRNARLRTAFSLLKLYSAGEHPISEHLIPPLLKADTPQWRIKEEELPDSPETRQLRWLEDAAQFSEFPLGTIREIERNVEAPSAVVVPASKNVPLQVARHGSHVFITNDEVANSPLKFIPLHHPSMRTVDLSELADEVNLIFAHPNSHQHHLQRLVFPENDPVKRILTNLQNEHEEESWEESEARSAQVDLPEGLNATADTFGTTILILPDDNPVKKYLQTIQNKQKQQHNETGEDEGTQGDENQRSAQFDLPEGLNATADTFGTTILILPDDNPVKKYLQTIQNKQKQQQNQTTVDEDMQQEERSATFGSQHLILPSRQQLLPPTTSFINQRPVILQPGLAQFPHQNTAFINRPFVRDSQQQQNTPQDSNDAERVGDSRKAEPTHHLHKHKLLHKKIGYQVPQNVIHIYQQQSANVQNHQKPSGYPRVASPFLIDVPERHSETNEEERVEREEERVKRSATFSRPSATAFFAPQQQPLIAQPVIVPQFSSFNEPTIFPQSPNFPFNPTNAILRSAEEKPQWMSADQLDSFLRSSGGQAPKLFPEENQSSILSNSKVSVGNNGSLSENVTEADDKPLTKEDIERIETTVPMVFPKPGGYFPIIQGTSPNGLPLQKPSDDPGFTDLQRIRPVNITALETDYFNFINKSSNQTSDNNSKPDTTSPLFFPPCAIPIIHATSQDGKPLAKPTDDPFYICLNKTKGRFDPLNHTVQECLGYQPVICAAKQETTGQERAAQEKTAPLHFFGFDEVASARARSDEIDFDDTVGPLQIFEFSNHDGDVDKISLVELEEVFPGQMREAEADPTHHHHHLLFHQHAYTPAYVAPTHHIDVTKVNAGFNLFHQKQLLDQDLHRGRQLVNVHGAANSVSQTQGQNVNINGDGNAVSQTQSVAQNSWGRNLHQGDLSGTDNFHGGQNVHITGEGNGVSQSQIQEASFDGDLNAHRIRRSLVELVTDPNVKLDVPKTLSNIGTVTKASFQDQKQPMYHLNNMGLIIPSQYRIINAADLDDNHLESKHEITRSINEDLIANGGEFQPAQEQNVDPLSDTFNRFGNAIRESIKAGQQTLAHVGDIAHSARQVVHTAKSAAPQVFLPRNQKSPDKVMLVTPKLLEIKNGDEAGVDLLQAQNRKDFVKAGDLMDALAVSNPSEETLGVEKIVIERKGGKRKPVIVGRSREADESNLKDFVSKMKGQFDSLIKDKLKQDREERRLRNTIKKLGRKSDARAPVVRLVQENPQKLENVLQDHIDIMKSKSDQIIETIQDVNGKFIDGFRAISGSNKSPSKNDETVVGVTHIIIPKNFQTTPKPNTRLKNVNAESDYWDKQVSSFLTELFEEKKPEEIVGSPQFTKNSLNLRPDLMKPFMGRASHSSLRRFLKKHGNSVEEDEVVGAAAQSTNSNEMEMEKIRQAKKVLGAINPLMFERLFNETMNETDTKSLSPYEVFTAGRNKTEVERVCQESAKVGTSMKITRELLKPFMGRLKGNEYMEVVPMENTVDQGDKQEIFITN